MRHEQIHDHDSYSKVDIAAVWPSSIQVAPLPIPDVEERFDAESFGPAPSAPDVPVGVGMLIVAAYLALIAAFTIATIASAQSIYMIVISFLFVVTFFTVPRIFLKIEPKTGGRPSFERFLHEGMDTLTGHNSGKAALVQMLIVPVFLTMGVLAMGVAAAIIF